MARSRSLPSDLFDDPDFFERDSDTQVILLGLDTYSHAIPTMQIGAAGRLSDLLTRS